jgi:hypothetical protein
MRDLNGPFFTLRTENWRLLRGWGQMGSARDALRPCSAGMYFYILGCLTRPNFNPLEIPSGPFSSPVSEGFGPFDLPETRQVGGD